MKKTICILLVLLLAFAAVSCGQTAEPADTQQEAVTTDDGVIDAEDYSAGLDENGHLIGIRALDYVTLPEYDRIEVPRSAVTPSDEQVGERMDAIVSSLDLTKTVNVTDRAVKDGDTVNIDYVGSVDGVEFERGNTKGAGTDVTIGETRYIDNFLEQLIGHMPGDEFDVNVTFPDPYEINPDLAGKPAVFRCTINYIVETVEREFTDEVVAEFSSSLYDCTTIEELHQYITDYYTDTSLSSFVQNYLIEHSVFSEIPDSVYQFQVNSMLLYYRSYAKAYGTTVEELVGRSEEQMIEEAKDNNMEQAKLLLVLQAIEEDCDGIVIDDELLNTYFLEEVGEEDYMSYIEEYGKGYVMLVVMNDTVIKYVRDHAVIVDAEKSDS